MEKEKYVGKQIIGLSWTGVSDIEYIDEIIDVDDLGFTLKRVGVLKKTFAGGLGQKVWVREQAKGSEGQINFYSHKYKDLHFTFLDSVEVFR